MKDDSPSRDVLVAVICGLFCHALHADCWTDVFFIVGCVVAGTIVLEAILD